MSDVKWVKGSEGYYREGKGYVVVVDDPDHRPIPLCCDICDYPMNMQEDQQAYLDFGCCDSCYLRWAQSRVQDWQGGWRPSGDDFDQYLKLRELQVPKFLV